MMSIWWNGEAVLQKFEKAWSTRYEQIMPQCWKKCNTHVKIKKCPHLRTLAPFYEHNMSISPTKVKEKWTNKALKMPWGSMYAAIMPLWRSNKGHLMGASCGHKGRHRPESKFYRLLFHTHENRNFNCWFVITTVFGRQRSHCFRDRRRGSIRL